MIVRFLGHLAVDENGQLHDPRELARFGERMPSSEFPPELIPENYQGARSENEEDAA